MKQQDARNCKGANYNGKKYLNKADLCYVRTERHEINSQSIYDAAIAHKEPKNEQSSRPLLQHVWSH